jgi:hypothetical protein
MDKGDLRPVSVRQDESARERVTGADDISRPAIRRSDYGAVRSLPPRIFAWTEVQAYVRVPP